MQFNLMPARIGLDAFIVIVHGNRQNLFGLGLANDVVIELVIQVLGRQQALASLTLFGGPLLENNIVTQVNTFIADIGRWSCNEALNLNLRFAAKLANEHHQL